MNYPSHLPEKTLHYFFVADRSGSMSDRIDEVRHELNHHFQELAEASRMSNTRIKVSFLQFDTQLNWICSGLPVEQMHSLNPKTFFARGSTALFDAIGQAIERASYQVGTKLDPEKEQVLIMVFTDGMENASRKFRGDSFREILEAHQHLPGWSITFTGCDPEVFNLMAHNAFKSDRMVSYQANEKVEAVKNMSDFVKEHVEKRSNFDKVAFTKHEDTDHAK